MKKKIAFVIIVLLVIGAIVLLEDKKPASNKTINEAGETMTKTVARKQKSLPDAPELAGIAGYINANKVSVQELVGKKVILIDFWTYSCINCQRTLPYITRWYEKYKDQGLEIIGVHSPEFGFEKNIENVKRAVKKWNITYPIVLDNDFETWRAYQNRYWPHKYLVDIDGYIVWDHVGEGGYEEAEMKIQELLKERMDRLGMKDGVKQTKPVVVDQHVDFGKIGTPEIYLGYEFTRGNFGNKEGLPEQKEVNYKLSKQIYSNQVYLEGLWFVDKDNVRLVSDSGKIVLKYQAKNVNIVAGGESSIMVTVDGKKIQDVKTAAEDLYTVVAGNDYAQRIVELEVAGKGFKLYTFTFG